MESEIELEALAEQVAYDASALRDGFEDRRFDLLALRQGNRSQEARVRAAILKQFPSFGHRLFTVVDGAAVAHSVVVVLQTDTQTLIEPGELREGDRIIAVGNYGLVDGTAVSSTRQDGTSGDTP